MLFSYADDCTLFYEITDENARSIVAQANSDLKQLEQWGIQWLVSFEPTKTHIFVASRKSKENTFDPSGISFMGKLIEQVKDVKIVGFIFDEKMTMEKILKHVSKKAKISLSHHLDSGNLEVMYKAFVRSTIECGNLEYLSAAPTHIAKLDKIQTAAEKAGEFKVETLSSRREAALIGLIFKLLDGDGRGGLNEFVPELHTTKTRNNKSDDHDLQIKRRLDFRETTKAYDRSIEGQAATVWSKVPQEILKVGEANGWQKITKQCQRFLTGKPLRASHIERNVVSANQDNKLNNKPLFSA